MVRRMVVLGLASTLVLAGAALADRKQVRVTAIGQRAARAAVVRRTDLLGSGWKGKVKMPKLGGATGCPSFRPKQSDLVVVGGAEASWSRSGVVIDSEAQVLKTPKMVRLDWKRTVTAPKVLPCLRHNVRASLSANERLAWVARMPLPRIPALGRLYRTVIVVDTRTAKTPVLVDALLVGKGRTEITLTTTALYASRKAVTREEVRLARILVRRAR
ncbi:MAG TPA: hypothetical protein VFA82_00550 [Gaiellaceae bacterium]|nr:hypothetical protein [Gaiellaceae bacterium]